MAVVALIVLGGAMLGFFFVKRFVLTPEGTVDAPTIFFSSWALRVIGGLLVLNVRLDDYLLGDACVKVRRANIIGGILILNMRLEGSNMYATSQSCTNTTSQTCTNTVLCCRQHLGAYDNWLLASC